MLSPKLWVRRQIQRPRYAFQWTLPSWMRQSAPAPSIGTRIGAVVDEAIGAGVHLNGPIPAFLWTQRALAHQFDLLGIRKDIGIRSPRPAQRATGVPIKGPGTVLKRCAQIGRASCR